MKKLKIGEIAKQFNISTRTLRFYEERGLLVPAEKSIDSEYRYYSEANAKQLSTILFLKEIGLSLDEISTYMKNNANNILKSKEVELSFKINQLRMFEKNKIDPSTYFLQRKHYKNEIWQNPLIEGVWKLDGIYASVLDIKNNKPPIKNKITPYRFLAFKKDGTSAWFFKAQYKQINFSTFWLPTNEEYRVSADSLILNIKNYNDHIFFSAKEEEFLRFPHALLFKRVSNSFEDYKPLLIYDIKPKRKASESHKGIYRLLGTTASLSFDDFTQTKERSYLEIDNNFARFSFDNKTHINYGSCLYNEESKQSLKLYSLKLKSKPVLVVENKTNTYTFSGLITNYLVFEQIN